jgi:hypothetical protein
MLMRFPTPAEWNLLHSVPVRVRAFLGFAG